MMFRFVLGVLLCSLLIAAPARAVPTEDQVRAAARWSADLQGALLSLMTGFQKVEEYTVAMDGYAAGETSLGEAQEAVGAVTTELNDGINSYVAALRSMPPHPMRREPIGKAAGEVRLQLIEQADEMRGFVARLDSVSREALNGDVGKTEQLAGEIFRGGALLMNGDIAMLRTQIGALDEVSPLRSLNLAQISEMQFIQEIMYYEATYRYGEAPGAPTGDLDAAGRHVASARESISNGRLNVEAVRAGLKAERASIATPSDLYDRLFPMLDTFAADWELFESTLDQADSLLDLMRSDSPDTDEAFSAYLETTGALSIALATSQTARSNMLGN